MPTNHSAHSRDSGRLVRRDDAQHPPCVCTSSAAVDAIDPFNAEAFAFSNPPVRWHVLHTKARQEKALAGALLARDLTCFLPLVSRSRVHGGRKRLVESPLFSSYVFLFGPVDATWFAIGTKRVANVIAVPDQSRFVREIDQIRIALEGGASLDPYAYLHIGRRARVTGGPFRGLEGVIEDKPKPDRLILQIQALGRATSLEIDPALLEAV